MVDQWEGDILETKLGQSQGVGAELTWKTANGSQPRVWAMGSKAGEANEDQLPEVLRSRLWGEGKEADVS